MDRQADGLPPSRRVPAAIAIWIAMAITVLDSTIVNVGLPYIAHALAVAPATGLWLVHGYQLAIVAGLLPLAALGDAWGYRRVYLAGLVLFTLASLGCALAGDWPLLLALRIAQGLGAAAIMSVNGALVRHVFPATRLGWAMGINALVIALSALAAPAMGGLILSVASWPWLFGIALLPGGMALAAGWRTLPCARGDGTPPDILAAAMSILAMLSLFGGAAAGFERGDPMLTMAALLLFAGAFTLLWRRSLRSAAPLLPVDLLKNPVLVRAYLGSICNFAAQMTLLSALPFYLRHQPGYPPWLIGLTVGAVPLGLAMASPWAGRRADRASADRVQGGGLMLAAGGLAGYALVPAAQPVAVALCGLIAGAGFGLFQAPNSRKMMAYAPRQRGGAAAGMLALSRLSGQIGGVAMAGWIFGLTASSNGRFGLVAAAIALIGSLTVMVSASKARTARSGD